MNFSDIYKKIRSIDEDAPPVPGSTPQPTTPTKSNAGLSWMEMSPEQQQVFVAKQKADRAAAATPIPAGLSWMEMSPEQQQVFVAKQKADRAAAALGLNECGDMMPHSPPQQDNVDMNVTLHGSGSGGIRDLMSILRDLEGKDSNGSMTVDPHADDLEIMVGDMEEEYGNSAPDASGPQTASIQDVTNVGTTTNGGDPKPRQAGLPQANAHSMHETVKSRLQQQYDSIKQEGTFDNIADTKLGDMPGKLATGAKQIYNNAATAAGKAATAVANTTPRQIGQGISDIGKKAADQIQASTRILPNAPRLPGVITDKFPKAAGQPAQSGQAGQPVEEPAELNGMRESTDFARVKQLNKILNG